MHINKLHVFSLLILSFPLIGYAGGVEYDDSYRVEPVIVVPIQPGSAEEPLMSPSAPLENEPPRAPRRIPEVRDPSRGMVQPYTDREGDARTLDQLSRDRMNVEGKRSRSLDDMASPMRERRANERARRPLDDPGERVYSTRSLRERQSMPDSRQEYYHESQRPDLREEYGHERGDEDYRVYRTR